MKFCWKKKMQIKPIYTVYGPNHNKTNFKCNQVKNSNFSATFFKVAQLDFLGGIPPKFEQ